ncbi:MAG TPA: ADOP family duplicated permease, partial [Gemmatimonadaceae bacterium]|nr:ADOP family duplicated permease [Gemmatimonadaceae bacterium]
NVIGRTVTINGQPFTVIGIAPPRYTGMMRGWASEIWVPTMMTPLLDPSNGEARLTHRGSRWVALVGRLKPGTGIEQARARFDVLTRAMQAEHPEEWVPRWGDSVRERYVSVLPERATRVHPALRGAAYALAALLFVVVNLVLLIACMNLAGMLFARAVARRSEIAVRLAIGAARSRIVRQLLTESLLMALLAGIAGVVLAFWGLDLLMASIPALPEGIRVALDVRVDWRAIAYTIAFATLAGLLFGLAPALHASRSAVSTVLKDDALALAAPMRRSRARKSLVVAQVALSLLLLIGAALMLRSLENVRPTRLGFASENALVAPLALDEATYGRGETHQFYERLSREIAGLPGVRSVSLVEGVPGGFMGRVRRGTEIDGYAPRAGESLEIDASVVGPRYFTNLGVPIVLGRDFDERDRDGAPCVAIVNEVFARTYFAGTGSALGRRLAGFRGPEGARQMCEIVGVVRDDAWQSLHEMRPVFSLALLQSDHRRMTLIVQSAGDPRPLVAEVRRTLRGLDPNLPVQVQTLGEYFSVAQYPFRLMGLVLGACGVLALLLATIGIYGTVAYGVAQRRREVGIRMALGAERAEILRLVIGQGMGMVGMGLGVGLVLGAGLTRVLTSLPLDLPLLFGVSATDVVTFAGMTLLLALTGLAACYVPALRAAKVDPATTLRTS